jgi:beta-galactosidase/beta-glucuronidase
LVRQRKSTKAGASILGDAQDAQTLPLDDRGWRRVDLPHDWSVEAHLSPSLASCTGYLPGGIGWYGKTITLPESLRGRKIYLYFEGVYNRSDVFLNGHSLGRRPNGYISFMYDSTPHARFGEENVITVKVDHGLSADSRWYTGSGIYRNVWLVHSSPVHIAQWGVYAHPELDGDTGLLNIEVEVTNETRENTGLSITHELLAPDGKVAAASSQPLSVESGKNGKSICTLRVERPQLWNLGNPVLYKLRTIVSRGAEALDSAMTTTGFRSLSFDPGKGMALNGEWIKIKGVCLHHDAGGLGAAIPRDVWKRRLVTLKNLGCNAIRTSHNPQAPDLYELCDELGLLVLNEAFDEWEFPKRKWLQGWNVGQPGYQGSSDFFDEWAERDMADMVRRDHNHPSIFAWSIGNEVDYPNDPYSHPVLGGRDAGGFVQPIFGGYKKDAPDAGRLGEIAKRLVAVVKKHDTSRPVTAGLAGVAMSNETEYPDALDITGYNYTESHYISDHKAHPGRVIFGSENGHQRSAWLAVTKNKHIFGQFLWTGIDYLGESRKWPSRGFNSGLLDFAGFIKPIGYFRQSL